jgi:hypothetical protein
LTISVTVSWPRSISTGRTPGGHLVREESNWHGRQMSTDLAGANALKIIKKCESYFEILLSKRKWLRGFELKKQSLMLVFKKGVAAQ